MLKRELQVGVMDKGKVGMMTTKKVHTVQVRVKNDNGIMNALHIVSKYVA